MHQYSKKYHILYMIYYCRHVENTSAKGCSVYSVPCWEMVVLLPRISFKSYRNLWMRTLHPLCPSAPSSIVVWCLNKQWELSFWTWPWNTWRCCLLLPFCATSLVSRLHHSYLLPTQAWPSATWLPALLGAGASFHSQDGTLLGNHLPTIFRT